MQRAGQSRQGVDGFADAQNPLCAVLEHVEQHDKLNVTASLRCISIMVGRTPKAHRDALRVRGHAGVGCRRLAAVGLLRRRRQSPAFPYFTNGRSRRLSRCSAFSRRLHAFSQTPAAAEPLTESPSRALHISVRAPALARKTPSPADDPRSTSDLTA